MDCIFCKIVAGEIPGTVVYQDDDIFAFRDINPEAPVHILVVPTRHIESVADLTEGDAGTVGHMVTVAKRLAQEAGIAVDGYRLIINCGPHGGQVVPHLHLHLLGGRKLGALG